MQDGKRKVWHATCTPQKHGLREQWRMVEDMLEKYRELNPFRKECVVEWHFLKVWNGRGMTDDRRTRFLREIYLIYVSKIRPPIKGVSSVFFLVVWKDRAMQDDKTKAWHATSTPSQKHGLIGQWRMIKESTEKYREPYPYREEWVAECHLSERVEWERHQGC